jgi:excisionase family DNA binding protein
MTASREFLRADEIARLCGVSVRTVRRWITAETLPSVKVGGVRLVARQTLQKTLAPAQADWGDDDPENEAKLEAYDGIGKTLSK